MKMNFGEYEVEIDIERTSAFYQTAAIVTEGCKCQGCRNYEAAAKQLDGTIREFFQKMGVDIRKPAEIYVNCRNEDGTLFYGGFYHVCGTILQGGSAWKQPGESEKEPTPCYQVTEDFQVSFENRIHLLEKGFPEPVIQLEIYGNVPWVLDETCEFQ